MTPGGYWIYQLADQSFYLVVAGELPVSVWESHHILPTCHDLQRSDLLCRVHLRHM